jgi:hypothetical protein
MSEDKKTGDDFKKSHQDEGTRDDKGRPIQGQTSINPNSRLLRQTPSSQRVEDNSRTEKAEDNTTNKNSYVDNVVKNANPGVNPNPLRRPLTAFGAPRRPVAPTPAKPTTLQERTSSEVAGKSVTTVQAPYVDSVVSKEGDLRGRDRPSSADLKTSRGEVGDMVVTVLPSPEEALEAGLLSPVHRGRALPLGPSDEALEVLRTARKARVEKRAGDEGGIPGEGSVPGRGRSGGTLREGAKEIMASQATLDQYLRRGKLLFDRWRREMRLTAGLDALSPIDFVNWLLSLKPSLKSSTWRMYRQCAIHYVEGWPGEDMNKAVEMLDNDAIDRSREPKEEQETSGRKRSKPERRTSALKEKRFPVEDFERVMTYLNQFSRSKVAQTTIDWLRAGVMTGLRPIEWRASDLEITADPKAARGRRAYLYVINAKATNGRGTGVVRTLDVSAFKDEELEVIRRMVDKARDWAIRGNYGDMQGKCSDLLYAATDRIWPTRRYAYSLYSCRHQAIANWKSIMEPSEIAAIVGHGVTATQGEHYGKRRSSWPPEAMPTLPRAVPEELAVVRDRIRMYDDRMKAEIKAGIRKENKAPEFPLG